MNNEAIIEELKQEQDQDGGLGLEKMYADEARRNKYSNLKLRHGLHWFLLILLTIEVVFLMFIIISQGAGLLLFTKEHFSLNEWAFGIFSNGALAQTYFLIKPVVADLFPGKNLKN